MFGDDDINFDLQLEKFGVDTNRLRENVVQHVFHAWVEDWEQEDRKNGCVVEARLLENTQLSLSGKKHGSFDIDEAMDGC